MADAGGAGEQTAGVLALRRRPWPVGLAAFLLVPYFITLGVGGAKLALNDLNNPYQTGFNGLGVLIGTVVIVVMVTGIGLTRLVVLGWLGALVLLAVLAVPTAWIEFHAMSIYLVDGGYPPWGSAWRMGLGFALHAPILVIGVVLLLLPPSWPWFARR